MPRKSGNTLTYPEFRIGKLALQREPLHRKTESRFVISAQGSLAVARRKRKKCAAFPFFHVARRTSHAPCLLATARNRVASSDVGLAAVPPLTWIKMICKASPRLTSPTGAL